MNRGAHSLSLGGRAGGGFAGGASTTSEGDDSAPTAASETDYILENGEALEGVRRAGHGGGRGGAAGVNASRRCGGSYLQLRSRFDDGPPEAFGGPLSPLGPRGARDAM